MEKLRKILKRYKIFISLLLINLIILFLYPSIGKKSMELSLKNTFEMLSVVPPIFILLGLLDVWVKRETMVKYMGEGSGFLGIILAFLLVLLQLDHCMQLFQ
jgi:uncharacterized membrane protein YraQ (UPF0718 family)